MKVAIIGAGNISKALGTSLTHAGHDVTLDASGPESAREAAAAIGASAADTNVAVDGAEVVVLSSPWRRRRQIADVAAGTGRRRRRRHHPDPAQGRLLGLPQPRARRPRSSSATARVPGRQGLRHISPATAPPPRYRRAWPATTRRRSRHDLPRRVDGPAAARRRAAERGARYLEGMAYLNMVSTPPTAGAGPRPRASPARQAPTFPTRCAGTDPGPRIAACRGLKAAAALRAASKECAGSRRGRSTRGPPLRSTKPPRQAQDGGEIR